MSKNMINEPPDPEIARRYVRWHKVKTGLEIHGRQTKIKEGEIYWAHLGQNIGSEIYGKGNNFTRPILIFKKFDSKLFLAIPLSSQDKTGTWYVPFEHRGKLQHAVLNQIKIMSVKRLGDKMGVIDDDDFDKIRAGFAKLYLGIDFLKNIPQVLSWGRSGDIPNV